MILRAFIGVVAIIVIALLLGQTRKIEHPATRLYMWFGAISVLLLLRWCL